MPQIARFVSRHVDSAPLSQPLNFNFSGRTATNRFLKGAMSERLASWSPTDLSARGIPSRELINLYTEWGKGGIGLILTGNIMISLDHLQDMGNIVIPSDAPFFDLRFDQFRKIARAAKAHGSLIIAQISHPGRQTPRTVQPRPISASDVQLEQNEYKGQFATNTKANLQNLAPPPKRTLSR